MNIPVTDHDVTVEPNDYASSSASRRGYNWSARCSCGGWSNGSEGEVRRWKLRHIKDEWVRLNRAGWVHLKGRF